MSRLVERVVQNDDIPFTRAEPGGVGGSQSSARDTAQRVGPTQHKQKWVRSSKVWKVMCQ